MPFLNYLITLNTPFGIVQIEAGASNPALAGKRALVHAMMWGVGERNELSIANIEPLEAS